MAPRVEDHPMGRSKLSGIDVFSTCPASTEVTRELYLQQVINVARWSEAWGCAGTLIDAGNSLVDPWLVAYTIIRHTRTLCPMVAVQPLYMHPYAVAKVVSTIGSLYGRRVLLNMDPGSFENDIVALNDLTPHDRRFDRLVEYTLVIKKLLGSPAPLTYRGEFYTVDRVELAPVAPPELFPGIFIADSPETGANAAARLGAIAVKCPKVASEETGPSDKSVKFAVRIGVLAREDADEAWKIAQTRFAGDRRGQPTQQAMKVSDSTSHRELGVPTPSVKKAPYWSGPFRNPKTMSPYLVGSHEEVAGEIAKYVRMGYRTFILDVPPNAEEFGHIAVVFNQLDSSPS